MTPDEMAANATGAMAAGTRMTLVRQRRAKLPQKFPRGKLLGENYNGTRVYSYDPAKVLAWLKETGLIDASRSTAKQGA